MTSGQAYVKLLEKKLILDFAEVAFELAMWKLETAIKKEKANGM